MLYYALLFLLMAIIAAVLGFGGLAATSVSIAKAIFMIVVVVFLISVIMQAGRRAG